VSEHRTGRLTPPPTPPRAAPIGAILAGGAGRRMGGDKAIVELHGKPLICYPLEAAREALGDAVIVAKPGTRLPDLPGVSVWLEPAAPRHPLVGVTEALALADGRPVVVCAADLPLVTARLLRRIAAADPGGAPAVVAAAAGAVQPLLGCYQPRALELLAPAARAASAPLREAVAAIDPVTLEVEDPEELFNVNSPDDLLMAAGLLDRKLSRAATPHPAPGRRPRRF
jgi:molybdenum cofactor guanylyltransferase